MKRKFLVMTVIVEICQKKKLLLVKKMVKYLLLDLNMMLVKCLLRFYF